MQIPRIEEYYRYSNEKEILYDLLATELKDNYRSALDVGAGSGRISQILSLKSKRLSLCEPNEFYLQTLKDKFPRATIIPTRIQDADLETYDCILASQSMYYHAPDSWVDVIGLMYNHLNIGGDLHIVINSDTGDWWESVKSIWSYAPEMLAFNYLPSSQLIHRLEEKHLVTTQRFSYQMNFPDRTALENYIRRSCIPLKENTPALGLLIELHLKTIPVENLKMTYFSELISLKRSR